MWLFGLWRSPKLLRVCILGIRADMISSIPALRNFYSLFCIQRWTDSVVFVQENAQSPPRSGRTPRCIILAPTRELAKQVEREFQDSSPSLTVGCYYGGVDIGQQIRQLRSGVDVAVGTPGRFIDLINRGNLNLALVSACSPTLVMLCMLMLTSS